MKNKLNAIFLTKIVMFLLTTAPIFSEPRENILFLRAPTQNVVADREKEKVSYYKIKNKAIKRISEFGLFSDTVSSIKMLPGVAGNGTFNAEMYIRGGSAYEVVGVMDQNPIYQPYFFGGRLSVFNPKIIEAIDFYPGGFDCSYGQSLSGILDVKTVDGNFKESESFLDANLTELNYYITNPIEKDKSTWMASFRRTYYDLFAPLFISDSYGPVSMPFLQSFQTKYTDKLSKGNTLRVHLNYFNDGADTPMEVISGGNQDGNMNYDSKRAIGSITLDSLIDPAVLNKAMFSFNHWEGFFKTTDDSNVDFNWKGTTIVFCDDLTIDVADNHQLQLGGLFYKGVSDETRSWSQLPDPEEPGSVTENIGFTFNDDVLITAVYLQDQWQISDQHQLKLGARLDRTKVGSHDWRSVWQPRVAYTFDYDGDTTYKLYSGKYSQQVIGINKTRRNDGHLEGVLANVSPELATHYGAGVERYLSDELLLKCEIFYKDYQDMVIDMGTYPIENKLNVGDGKSGGLELMLQKFAGDDYEGWLTYTYSKARREDKEGWFTPHYDLTHMVNAYGEFKLDDMKRIILTMQYSTGRPYTPIYSSKTNPDTGAEEYMLGDRYSKRMTDYFRLDFWLEWNGVSLLCPIPFMADTKEKALGIFPIFKFNGVTRLGLYDALGIRNVLGTYWNKDTQSQEGIFDLGFMPVYGIRIDF